MGNFNLSAPNLPIMRLCGNCGSVRKRQAGLLNGKRVCQDLICREAPNKFNERIGSVITRHFFSCWTGTLKVRPLIQILATARRRGLRSRSRNERLLPRSHDQQP